MQAEIAQPVKFKNGSIIVIGESPGAVNIFVNHRFNRFQKKMIKWCFGFDVFDFSGD